MESLKVVKQHTTTTIVKSGHNALELPIGGWAITWGINSNSNCCIIIHSPGQELAAKKEGVDV